MTLDSFLDRLRAGLVVVADGATGTNLQARGLLAGTAPEVWLFDRPDAVVQLHRDFIAAGAQLVLTNTFGATRPRLEHAGLSDRTVEVNQRAVALARQAAGGQDVYVAGSLGPTGQLLEPLGPLTPSQAAAAYAEQARALAEAGADLLVVETQFDLGEAMSAVEGVRSATRLPLVVSFSFDMGTRTMMGLRPEAAARELDAAGVDVIGVNCGRSLEENLANLRAVRAATQRPLWMKPNAGLPHMNGDMAVYDVSPEEMGTQARAWLKAGAAVIGGCCGTTPEHLRAIAQAAQEAVMGSQ